MKALLNRLTFIALLALVVSLSWIASASAVEVDKGKIPIDHLVSNFKQLPWAVTIWDEDEALVQLKKKEKVLWVDTRPAAFFEKGTVRGAVLMPYDKSGQEGNVLTSEKLKATLSAANLPGASTKIVFFCQGPKCHRSYNATYAAVKAWGLNPNNIVWFRAGYPELFKMIKATPKLKRRAKRYLSNSGLSQL